MKIKVSFFLIIFYISINCFAQEVDDTKWITNGKVSTLLKKDSILYVGGDFRYIGPNTGSLALIDKSSGKPAGSFPKVNGKVLAVVKDTAGGFFIGGWFDRVGGFERKNVAHLDKDLKVTDWKIETDGVVSALACNHENLYIAGDFTNVGGTFRSDFAEVDIVTAVVTSFDLLLPSNIPGIGGRYLNTLLLDKDKLYLGGSFSSVLNQSRSCAAGVNIKTETLLPWDPDVSGSTNGLKVNTILKTKSSIFIAGHFYKVKEFERSNLAEVDTLSGNPTDFDVKVGTYYIGHNSIAIKDSLLAIATTPVTLVNIKTKQTEQINGFTDSPKVLSIAGDTLLIGGYAFTTYNLKSRTILTQAKTSYIGVQSISKYGDYYYVGGDYNSIGGENRNSLAGINTATGLPTSFNPALGVVYIHGNPHIKALAIHDNFLFVGGKFQYAGHPTMRHSYLAQFDLNTGQVTDWNARLDGDDSSSDGEVTHIVVNGSSLYIQTNAHSLDGQRNIGSLLKLDTYTAKNKFFGTHYFGGDTYRPGKVNVMKLINGDLFVGGQFVSASGIKKNSLAVFNTITGSLRPWDAHLPDFSEITDMEFYFDSLIITGKFSSLNSVPAYNIAKIGILDPKPSNSFKLSFDDKVKDIEIYGNTIYAAGDFTSVNGLSKRHLAAINIATKEVSSWNAFIPYFGNKIGPEVIKIDEGRLLFGGSFEYVGSVYTPNLATLSLTPKIFNKISGKVIFDENENCTKDSLERGLAGYRINAQPGHYSAVSDVNGEYVIEVHPDVFSVSQEPKNKKGLIIVELCPEKRGSHLVDMRDAKDTSDINFYNKITESYYLSVDVESDRRRRCFRNYTTVSYCNEGQLGVKDVEIKVQFPEYVIPLSSTLPWKQVNGNEYTFTIGELSATGCGYFVITDSVICGKEEIRGLTQCTKASIFPKNDISEDPQWDKSDVSLSAICKENGFVEFKVENIGVGTMADSLDFRIYIDALLVFTKKYKLSPQGFIKLKVPANGKTVRLEADQSPFYPGPSKPSLTVEGCGGNPEVTISKGFVDQQPQNDEEDGVEISCMEIRDSYDPNDKQARPTGITENHYIEKGQELEYVIRFQNTGTDTAYTVTVSDELSGYLDTATFVMVSASHPYKISYGNTFNPSIVWTFEKINLPDSGTNQQKSNGYLKFRIKQKKDVVYGSYIYNHAAIVFDFNSPIVTNQTVNVVWNLPLLNDSFKGIELCYLAPSAALAGENISVCEVNSVSLNAVAPEVGSGRWKVLEGTGLLADSRNPHSIVNNLSYGQNLLEWSVTNCDSTNTTQVIINRTKKPELPVVESEVSYCTDGQVLPIKAVGNQVKWYSDPSLSVLISEGNEYQPSSRVPHSVFVTQKDGECSSEPKVIRIVFHTPPSPPVIETESFSCSDEPVKLIAFGEGIRWFQNASLSEWLGEGTEFVFQGKNTDTLFVTQTTNGCISKPERIIVNRKTFALNKNLISNVFTPNGDGRNDVFFLTNNEVKECLGDFDKVIIKNRWGKKVYESKDENFKWEANGVGNGVYFYFVKYQKRSFQGTLTILR